MSHKKRCATSVALAATMVLALAACGSDTDTPTSPASGTAGSQSGASSSAQTSSAQTESGGSSEPAASEQGSAGSGSAGSGSAGAGSSSAPGVTLNQKLHDQLPDKIKESGTLTSVMSGAFPPYTIPEQGGQKWTGAAIDLGNALGTILGVKINTVAVEGLAGVLSGLESGRYDFAMGPIGDYADRRKAHDFVDWVQEFVAFLVPNGNEHGIESLDDICGLAIAVQAGGSAEDVVRNKSDECGANGEKAVTVKSFKDQPSSVLAVKAGRADAFFSSQAPLVYFAQQSNDELTVVAKGKANGFDPIRQGAVFPKDSELTQPVLKGMQILFQTGTYATIMKKYGLDSEILPEPGLNLGASHE